MLLADKRFYGTIALASADNLASQQLGEYKQRISMPKVQVLHGNKRQYG